MRIGDNFSNRIIKYYRIKSEVLPNVVIKKKYRDNAKIWNTKSLKYRHKERHSFGSRDKGQKYGYPNCEFRVKTEIILNDLI